MAVKDLVDRFESSDSQQPPSTPARFITVQSRNLRNRKPSLPQETMDDESGSATAFTTRIPSVNNNYTTLDITDAAQPFIGIQYLEVEEDEVPYRSRPISYEDDETWRLIEPDHTYPPSSASQHSFSITPTLVHSRHTLGQHNPISPTELFSRKAPPLYLPKLDSYLESLPQPPFNNVKTNREAEMFPPMDRLVESGYSVEELEANSRVAPFWRNKKTLLGSAVNVVLGITGSSMLASFYSLQGVVNTVQVFALILSTIVPFKGERLGDHWRKLLLGTIPNVLALNFASGTMQSLIFLTVFMVTASGLLYRFWKSTRKCDRYTEIEGLQQNDKNGKEWKLVTISFLLTLIYLPMSTMAVHVLVWSQDLWPIPNPYTNATSFPPVVPPLGPSHEYRDPLDFCWTTTMKKNEFNFAPIVIILSIVTILFLTIYYPIALRRVIRTSVPKVDRFTELGRPRNPVDMDTEYHRLLARDTNPFAFLYAGFRRDWGTYEPIYLFVKLSTLVIVAVIDPDNCFFRSAPRAVIPIVRQVLLLTSTVGFFLAQCFLGPFLDPVNNASEWVSRLNYVLTSLLALLVTLDVPGKDLLNYYVLYGIYILTYGFSLYFTVINLSISRKTVKKLTRRIDFSIDVFSPRLALSYPSPHLKRRIWQESISILLLTSPECKIPPQQKMVFAQARDSEFPPYLLNFLGSPAERHVENLKILREVGSLEYRKAVALMYGPDFERTRQLEEEIQRYFTGPDSYWKPPEENAILNCTHFFGNAWMIPFPPTLVFRYDIGPYTVLRDVSDLELYVRQNSSREIQQRREIRMSLRSLDGQMVSWRYNHVQAIGSQSLCCGLRKRYSAQASRRYETAILKIEQRGNLVWQGVQLGSGFTVKLKYPRGIILDGEAIGLTDDFDLTTLLARFLTSNHPLIHTRLRHLESVLSDYRHHHRKECQYKAQVLSYKFLSHVYDLPRDPTVMVGSSIDYERDPRVRQLIAGSEAIFDTAYMRFLSVSRSEAATWWYVFWDDLWRRNWDTIAGLQLHATDFNPHYPTSIAYMPLPRPALESFLAQRNLFSKKPRWGDFFHPGFLNKLYLRLNEAVFRGSSKQILFHMGNGISELDMDHVDVEMRAQASNIGTGGGTDHDDASILQRPTYRWEGLLEDPPYPFQRQQRKFMSKVTAWLGLAPTWRAGIPVQGVSIDVRLQDGRYVLLEKPSTSKDND
ncbi:hypothetical protein E1B28_001051 [Marasmius oreades]|uniref:Uncharacterized protein n=1 Tax=Marasmius oreades TaxID=181124 RepID=A0A9P7V2R8_9AGAR|nr:uncharacterized protein E1B28_001051 [Marasmius oreades]KAG7099182.1 hypothetical protein E1B28_001051 [Marasmius oreades]